MAPNIRTTASRLVYENRWAAPAAPAPPPAAAPAGESTIDQPKEPGELKSQGVITEEGIAAQKAKLLG